jgi:hypothetical protein
MNCVRSKTRNKRKYGRNSHNVWKKIVLDQKQNKWRRNQYKGSLTRQKQEEMDTESTWEDRESKSRHPLTLGPLITAEFEAAATRRTFGTPPPLGCIQYKDRLQYT